MTGPFLLIASAVLAAAAPAQAAGPRAILKTQSKTVTENSSALVTVRCPSGFVATFGGVTTTTSAEVEDSLAAGAGAWRFRLVNPPGYSDARVGMAVRCLAPPRDSRLARVPAYSVSWVRGEPKVIGPDNARQVRVRCGSGSAPAGYGWDQAVLNSSQAARGGTGHLPSSVPEGDRGWLFNIDNHWDAPVAVRFTPFLRCLKTTLRARDRAGRVRTHTVRRSTVSRNGAAPRPGLNDYALSCGSRRGVTLTPGHVFGPSGETRLRRSAVAGTQSARWQVEYRPSLALTPTARLHLICARQASSWR